MIHGVKSTLVYVDERIAVVNKAPGVSLATPRSEPHGAVARLVQDLGADECESYGLAAESLWLVHRLDVGTSGLVLLARDSGMHRSLSLDLAAKRITRVYVALVWGHPRPAEGRWDDPIGPDRNDRRRMKPDPAGRPAATRYRTLRRASHASLVELRPETGRTHQIRVHLAGAGHWLVGDDLYAGARHRSVREPRLRTLLSPSHPFLHAWQLVLPATRTFPGLTLEAPLPDDFCAALEGLGVKIPY
jgi:23S rRNA pseudouridine1911/1915/1917 synthase